MAEHSPNKPKITRAQAKAVHNYHDLPPGGVWRTINGRHVYIVNHKIVAGSLPWVNEKGDVEARKMTDEHIKEIQKHYDKRREKEERKKKKQQQDPEEERLLSDLKKWQKEHQKRVEQISKIEDRNKWFEEEMNRFREERRKTKEFRERSKNLYIYHGTAMYSAEQIKKHGFQTNGSYRDFGNAAYFKSPQYDDLDADYGSEHDMHIEDTYSMMRMFADYHYEPAVIHCRIPKEGILDLTTMEIPKELEQLRKQIYTVHEMYGNDNSATRFQELHRAAYAYLTGKKYTDVPLIIKKDDFLKAIDSLNTKDVFKQRLRETVDRIYTSAQSSKDRWYAFSPYELYCCKNGYFAVVDILPYWENEGYQIGVYDPSKIEILDIGKKVEGFGATLKLIKAMLLLSLVYKSQNKNQPESLPYCLLRVMKKDGHYHFFVGAFQGKEEKKKSVKLYITL